MYIETDSASSRLTDIDQIHNDDISNVLILNKKATSNQEHQLFKTELEKFRPHQNRILQAVHKQSALMKELTRTYGDLLQDKRVRSEQNKYEAFSRQRNSVLSKYRKVYQGYTDLQAGLLRAQQFYEEMKDTVDSMQKNVESFVENRRSEGGQLLSAIEAAKGSGADREQARLKELMERMSVSPSTQSSASPIPGAADYRNSNHRLPPLQHLYNPVTSPPATPQYQSNGVRSPNYNHVQPPPTNGSYTRDSYQAQGRDSYNPGSYGPVSPPAHQQYFSPPPSQQYANYQQQQPSTTHYSQHAPPQPQQYAGGQSVPPGWQPPPPPPGPPPSQDYSALQATQYPSGPGGFATHDPRRSAQTQAGGGDPWAGLSGWK